MKANELPIITFLQAVNVQFVIPVYQRNYDWKNAECKELLNDIISVETENRGTHFIGSIVFVHEGTYSTSEVKELVIIDGQQRLTTINILYVALYRFAKENSKAQDAEKLYNMFLTNQYVQNESSKLKLKQTDTNSLAFKAIMLGTQNEFATFSNVIENYNYFRSCINEENFDLILRGLNRLIFVEISLERDKDDPQRIFESLNSTGLDLSQSDLIRNFILMDLPPKDQNRIFETIWNPIEENAKDIVKQSSLVSDFIRDYLTLRNKKIPNKNKVYAEFKSLYSNKKEEAYHQELENIKSLSVHYKKLVNPTTVSDANIRKELEYINRLEINVAYPFLLQVFEDAENGLLSKEDLLKILKLIQSYAWRRFIVGLPTNALNKIFMSLYAEVDTEEYYDSLAKVLLKKKGSAKFPTNEDLKTALRDKDLYNTQPKNRNYLFEMLENYNNREYVNTNNEHITIEHIFPRNPNTDWSTELSPEDYFLFKEKHLNTIGNLTLSGNNGALSNKSFLSKKEMNIDGNEQGYNYSRLWLNTYLKSLNSWNVAKYEERLNIIYDRFLKIWEYPDVVIFESEDSSDEQNIFDAESPKNKKLEYFIFENTTIEEDTVARMYFYVIRNLYEKNSQLLLNSQDIFKITRNTTDFRAPQEIINGWYVESNIDSNTKFASLKRLLTLFEMEEELSIKYSSGTENQSEPNRFNIRKKYWQQLLPLIENTSLFSNVNASKESWISSGAGIAGLSFTFVISKSYARIEMTILTSSKETNKMYFKRLHKNKEIIEQTFGKKLVWEELPENKMCRIKFEKQDVNLYNESDWETMNEFMVSNLPIFEKAFQPFIKNIR
ncbi:DUF4268 domain-containing protein [Flavobacterium nackdongense]|jgi:uncharacterized protein with ParB-like and HNH nuclease domain|uniref:DUF4268 domain-containing protein n=1 Tax=Flavobacterium nackdongense TaxID=2547394 RepID=A0A4P6Y597_9FLAO|nr:DUF4268 domain-containing protein [Flavobacterium nackdongense]QBN17266.1 DUF4268 domain-containing protein [Flavobacterium nackdongense]